MLVEQHPYQQGQRVAGEQVVGCVVGGEVEGHASSLASGRRLVQGVPKR